MAKQGDVLPLLGMLVAAYPNQKVPAETLKLYEMFLSDVDYDVLNEAIGMCIRDRDNTFFPAVGEIRKYAVQIILKHAGIKSAEMAWEEVVDNMRKIGHIGAPYWTSEHIRRCVKAIGWWDICMSENPGITRSAFIKLYNEVLNDLRADLTLHASLPALPEGANGSQKAVAVRYGFDGKIVPIQDMGPADESNQLVVMPELRRI